MKTIDMSNIHLTANIFIIPNRAPQIDDFFECVQAEKLDYATRIAELNGFTFDSKKDYLVETWMVCEEYDCDNLADHGIHYQDTDGTEYAIGIESAYLPSNLFDGKQEGDVIKVKLPIWYSTETQFYKIGSTCTTADFEITLNQGDYRYCRFGTFEEVLKKVMY